MPLDATWKSVLRVWFAFIWRATGAFFLLCGASLVTTIVCAIFTMRFIGWTQHQAEQVFGPYYLIGLAAAFPVAGLIAFRLLLKAKFFGFRLAIVPDEPADDASLGDGWMHTPQPPAPAPAWTARPR